MSLCAFSTPPVVMLHRTTTPSVSASMTRPPQLYVPSPRQRPRSQISGLDASAHNGTSARTFQHLTWTDVETLSTQLVDQFQSSETIFDTILAVTRGGLVPATLISQSLELRTVLAATVMFYSDDGEKFFGMTEPRFLSFPSPDALKGRRVLIVDDVWDSGRTMRSVREKVKRANPADVKVSVMHFKKGHNRFVDDAPDFFVDITDDWIVYPWERAAPDSPAPPDVMVDGLHAAVDPDASVKG